MSIEKQEVWKCDLCGNEKLVKTNPHDGWIKFEVDDLYEERRWHTKAVCPDCLKVMKSAERCGQPYPKDSK